MKHAPAPNWQVLQKSVPGRKNGLQTSLQIEISSEIDALLGRQSFSSLDFEAEEKETRRRALGLATYRLEQWLNTDSSDSVASEHPCLRGSCVQYRGRHEKTFEKVLGALLLERAYDHCDQRQSGFCPRDRTLMLELFSLTPGILRMISSVASIESFEESSELSQELARAELSAKQVKLPAEALGTKSPPRSRKRGQAKWLSPNV